jgi:hypothetical protein
LKSLTFFFLVLDFFLTTTSSDSESLSSKTFFFLRLRLILEFNCLANAAFASSWSVAVSVFFFAFLDFLTGAGDALDSSLD